MLHKKIFNLIINNIDFEALYIKKKIEFTIWINDIWIDIKGNLINIHLNGIGTSGTYEQDNYSSYVIKVWDIIDTLIVFYLNDTDTRLRTEDEVLEFRND